MNKNNSERIAKTAAFASGQLEELLSMLPPSQLAKDIRKITDRIDKEFSVVSLSIPVES
jgi:hypothetical protein